MADESSMALSTILRSIADRLDNGGGIVSNLEGLRLRDANGNQVGKIIVDWDEDDEDDEDEDENDEDDDLLFSDDEEPYSHRNKFRL